MSIIKSEHPSEKMMLIVWRCSTQRAPTTRWNLLVRSIPRLVFILLLDILYEALVLHFLRIICISMQVRRCSWRCNTWRHVSLYLADHVRDDLHRTNRQESSHWLRQFPSDEEYFPYPPHLCSYPSLSSNAIIYTSACEPHRRFSRIDHCSRPECQLTRNLPSHDQAPPSVRKELSSATPLPSYMLDKMICIHRNEPIPTMAMLPQHAQTLQILQTNHLRSLMSIDSLNTREKEFNPVKRSNPNPPSKVEKMDVATQWSLQSSALK